MIRVLLHALFLGAFSAVALSAQAAKTKVQCATTADFVELEGRDTIALSRVFFTDSTFESTTRSLEQGAMVRYTGRLDANGEPRVLHMEIWPRSADSAGPPAQIADVTVQGADVSARVAAPARGVQMQHDHLPAGGVVYMNSAPVFLDLFQRHVHLAVGATTTVSALWLFSGGAVDTVRVTRPATDSLVLQFREMAYSLALAPNRSLLGAATQSTSSTAGAPLRLVRRDCR